MSSAELCPAHQPPCLPRHVAKGPGWLSMGLPPWATGFQTPADVPRGGREGASSESLIEQGVRVRGHSPGQPGVCRSSWVTGRGSQLGLRPLGRRGQVEPAHWQRACPLLVSQEAGSWGSRSLEAHLLGAGGGRAGRGLSWPAANPTGPGQSLELAPPDSPQIEARRTGLCTLCITGTDCHPPDSRG